jgi:hypothetical protein
MSVRVRHGEVVDSGGRLYTDNLRNARQADEYVLAGGPAVLEPRFTVHGFRHAEVTGYPGEPEPGDIVARVVHSDIAAAGSWGSAEPWLDRLFRSIDWGQRGNFISVPTERPHPCGPLDRVHGSYQSARGPVRAGWERSGGQFTYRVEVPPNALASVRVPSADPARVRDAAGGQPAAVGDYLGLLGVGEAVFQVGPGRHEFSGPDLQVSR